METQAKGWKMFKIQASYGRKEVNPIDVIARSERYQTNVAPH